MSINSKIIIGVDPGTNIMGYGLLEVNSQEIKCIDFNVINMKKTEEWQDKIKTIYTIISEIITYYKPNEFVIEAPFYGKNIQSMLKLGRAQGVAIAAAVVNNLPVYEYSPKKIKQSITGSGSASKEQVNIMVQRIVKLTKNINYLDESDALAVALCHHFQNKTIDLKSSKKNGWADFIKNNPDKIK
jgi:crossover junction endodeoxyribonuclease RuvC